MDGRVFCVHGGLSPAVARLDQVSLAVPLVVDGENSGIAETTSHCCIRADSSPCPAKGLTIGEFEMFELTKDTNDRSKTRSTA